MHKYKSAHNLLLQLLRSKTYDEYRYKYKLRPQAMRHFGIEKLHGSTAEETQNDKYLTLSSRAATWSSG